jgi:hypothetical protein
MVSITALSVIVKVKLYFLPYLRYPGIVGERAFNTMVSMVSYSWNRRIIIVIKQGNLPPLKRITLIIHQATVLGVFMISRSSECPPPRGRRAPMRYFVKPGYIVSLIVTIRSFQRVKGNIGKPIIKRNFLGSLARDGIRCKAG